MAQTKQNRLIEIVTAGHNSVLGTIYHEFGKDIEYLNDYSWVIFTNTDSFGMIEDECKSLKLEEYIIADRRTMIVKSSN